jgi:putative mRNA 3-end processing factor
MSARDILTLRPEGLYCPAGDFYVDPARPVPRAVITHGHADHARTGHGAVLATPETLDIMAARYGQHFCKARQALTYRETLYLGGVDVMLVPAGHVLGSAQVCITGRGAGQSGTIVVSGDYKRQRDPTCTAFEPVRCDIFITEATFALPVFRMPDAAAEIQKLLQSTRIFPGKAHLAGAYSLGKAQRLAALIRAGGWDRPLYLHGAMDKITRLYEEHGISFGETRPVTAENKRKLAGEIVLCPPSALSSTWSAGMGETLTCFASGWMRIRAHARKRGIELPLSISDHADWDDLTSTIIETGCEEVWITHGEDAALTHWASLRQLRARPLHMLGYGEEEANEASANVLAETGP